jgi:hypothetical protein
MAKADRLTRPYFDIFSFLLRNFLRNKLRSLNSVVSVVQSCPISRVHTWKTMGQTRSLIPMLKKFHGGQKIIFFGFKLDKKDIQIDFVIKNNMREKFNH